MNNSQLELREFMFPYNQPRGYKQGLENMLINDSCGLILLDCIVCGDKLETIRDTRNRACAPCNERKQNEYR